MKRATTSQFGDYLRNLRQQRKLGIRQLGRMSGIDSGALTRIERDERAPTPQTLQALAAALEVPLADLFARAGFATPYDLPAVDSYFHARYGHLPEDVLASMNDYCQRLIDEYGFDPAGPAAREDEKDELSKQ
ncbi:MAG TPA: helix-turn-helix transcriptional regulator [Pseudonocardiaceae bacterium]|jgi:transcriptional regulator with XRE-family HTH domain|nr:helix-turn-helix transcriptional regulator [Pseudonocardiaceae bacterium]